MTQKNKRVTYNRNQPKTVQRFTKPVIIAHWLNAAAFFTLYLSGLPMYTEFFDWLYVIFGSPANARLLHRIAGVVFILPVIYILIADPKSFIYWIKQIFSWKSHDIKFLLEFPKEFFGGKSNAPKQDFYNAGEKINSILTILTAVMLIGSGFVMWFPEYFSQSIILWSYPIHNIGLGLSVAVVVGHIYLSIGHPHSQEAIKGMTTGEVSIEYARDHHGRWYDELQQEESEKQKRA